VTYTDTELLDFLQELTDKSDSAGRVVMRDSSIGRGWRLHESSADFAVKDVRSAITTYMKSIKRFKK